MPSTPVPIFGGCPPNPSLATLRQRVEHHLVPCGLRAKSAKEFVELVAAWLDAPRKTLTIDAAKTLYEALRTHDAIMVSEPDEDGLLGG